MAIRSGKTLKVEKKGARDREKCLLIVVGNSGGGEIPGSGVGLCVGCSCWILVGAILYANFGEWVNGRCAKVRKSFESVKVLFCERCIKLVMGMLEPDEKCHFVVRWS